MAAAPIVIRLPRTAYLIVVFLLVGAIPVAFADSSTHNVEDTVNGVAKTGFSVGWTVVVLIVPVLAAFFVARTATIVSSTGIRVRAVFGSRDLPWPTIRGLSVDGRVVYAVQSDGRTRLPCVRLAHLGPITRMSEGRLPELPDATPKPAPSRRRQR